MAEKDEHGLRISEIVKKGAGEQKRRDGQPIIDESTRNSEKIRLSDLDYLKQKGMMKETAEDRSATAKEEKEEDSRRETGFSLKDLEGLRPFQKKSMPVVPSSGAGGDVSEGSEDRTTDRLSLREFDALKAKKKKTIRPAKTVAGRRDLDARRWWMEETKFFWRTPGRKSCPWMGRLKDRHS